MLGQQPPTLFLIEKQNRTWTEAFFFRRRDCGDRIRPAKGRGVLAFEFFIQASVEQDQEAETVGLEQSALAQPAITVLARRIIQPITGVGKTAVETRKELIPGIVVPVETEVVALSRSEGGTA